jgi:serine/threonine protein kinase/WD40 repeat protein
MASTCRLSVAGNSWGRSFCDKTLIVPRTGSDGLEPEIPLEREGQYTRLEELGRGGQSVVVRAFDEFVAREVALKELAVAHAGEPSASTPSGQVPETERQEAARRRFLREARLTARLDHPGIVSVLELARRPDGTVFCAQKLIRGETLKKRLERCTSLRERLQLLPHLIDACQAVAYAHAHGVIHRDLKPSNIMVGSFGETVVVDWGLAKVSGDPESGEPEMAELLTALGRGTELTRTGLAMGTPGYMSPEQARGERMSVDERSDVFSLGVVLYEFLTGRVPFDGATTEHIVERLLTGRFHPVRAVTPEVPAELAAIAGRALDLAPEGRYPNAGALAAELDAYAAGGKVHAYRYRPWELLKKFIAANRALSAVTAVALLVLLAAAGIILRQFQVTRANLAQSFIERARTAETSSDWARAAGYYAASRVEQDSLEARWGYALAAEHISPRLFFRRGVASSYLDVGLLPGGRVLSLGRQGQFLVGSDLESGAELWRMEMPESASRVWFQPYRLVSMTSTTPGKASDPEQRTTVLDAVTGRVLGSFDYAVGHPCWRSPFPPPVLVSAAGLVTAREGTTPKILAPTVKRPWSCAVSEDGHRVAFDDSRGFVHVWSLDDDQEIGHRVASDVRDLLFTRHGVAVVRASTIDLFAGDEGDFSVEIPQGSGTITRPFPGAVVAANDGHRLILDRGGTNHADLVDLESRTVLSSFSYAPGVARFAFSADGGRLFAVGLLGGSSLTAWELRPVKPRRVFEGGAHDSFFASADGRRILIFHFAMDSSSWELYDENGVRLLAGSLGYRANVNISPNGNRILTRDGDGVRVLDADTGRVVWEIACNDCLRLEPSADGRRFLSSSGKRITLWAEGSPDPIWTETERVGPTGGALRLSLDGTRVAWGHGGIARVHTLGSPTEFEARFEEDVSDVSFSNDGKRLVVASRSEIAAWRVGSWEPLWRVPSFASSYVALDTSSDDSIVLIEHDALGTALLDGETGHHLATVRPSKPRSVYPAEALLPSLKRKISRGGGRWELWDFPEPDRASPRESLARITAAAGLQMQGVELVDVAPPAAASRSQP